MLGIPEALVCLIKQNCDQDRKCERCAHGTQNDHRRRVARWLQRGDCRIEHRDVGNRGSFSELRLRRLQIEVLVHLCRDFDLSLKSLFFDRSCRNPPKVLTREGDVRLELPLPELRLRQKRLDSARYRRCAERRQCGHDIFHPTEFVRVTLTQLAKVELLG